MKARGIILAAGRGSRMNGHTAQRPKCLIEVGGKALLHWQLDAMRAAGIDAIGIVTGYQREQLDHADLREFHNARWGTTNMVSSLECARDWLESGTCIVSYSDIFYASSAIASLLACAHPLAITYDPNWRALWERRFADPLCDAETFRLDEEGRLREIGNTPASLDDIQGQYMGLLRFEPEGWQEIARLRADMAPEECDRMHLTGTLQRVIAARHVPIHAVAYRETWGEVDNEQDLVLYQETFARH